MKKLYTTPIAQKVNFNYRQQVVTASSSEDDGCDEFWSQKKGTNCTSNLVSYGD